MAKIDDPTSKEAALTETTSPRHRSIQEVRIKKSFAFFIWPKTYIKSNAFSYPQPYQTTTFGVRRRVMRSLQ